MKTQIFQEFQINGDDEEEEEEEEGVQQLQQQQQQLALIQNAEDMPNIVTCFTFNPYICPVRWWLLLNHHSTDEET